MTKASPNPRRYSRGPEGLDPDQPLKVYMSLRVEQTDLDRAATRLEKLVGEHPSAVIAVVAYRREAERVLLTIEVDMGPARAALRGTGAQAHHGYAFLWALAKAFYYARPVFCAPPSEEERATVPARRSTETATAPVALAG